MLVIDKSVVETKYEDQGKTIGITNTIRIVPVGLRYLPIKFKISDQVDVAFEYTVIFELYLNYYSALFFVEKGRPF